ncbi:hypothetical protein [Deefgea piscis]|uniref:hypothetical protein n=1 Tax=Deefgea piscis TaxID=2739061 RepID=UPI001C80791A|nr:hypothetical protein [Deefgea piscis]QZA80208.1 hypothetical protein K4H25_11760 [Deefgea piscis]
MDHNNLIAWAETALQNIVNNPVQGDLAESTYRAVGSRAYYAIFHASQSLCNRLLLPPSAKDDSIKGSHEKLYQRMIECTSTRHTSHVTIRKLAYRARGDQKMTRVHADYNFTDEFTLAQASDILNEAKTMIAEADKIT